MGPADYEKILDTKLEALKEIIELKINTVNLGVQLVNKRIDDQVAVLKWICGGLFFPLILLIIAMIGGKLI